MGSPPNLTRQDEKRLKILAAAEETFLEKGFHACHFLKSVDYLMLLNLVKVYCLKSNP